MPADNDGKVVPQNKPGADCLGDVLAGNPVPVGGPGGGGGGGWAALAGILAALGGVHPAQLVMGAVGVCRTASVKVVTAQPLWETSHKIITCYHLSLVITYPGRVQVFVHIGGGFTFLVSGFQCYNK